MSPLDSSQVHRSQNFIITIIRNALQVGEALTSPQFLSRAVL